MDEPENPAKQSKISISKSCEYAGGCDREATRNFPAEPVKGWLCENHFLEVLNAAAEVEAAARRKFAVEWHAHFEKYLRDQNLNLAELTEAQSRQIGDEVRRWVREKGAIQISPWPSKPTKLAFVGFVAFGVAVLRGELQSALLAGS